LFKSVDITMTPSAGNEFDSFGNFRNTVTIRPTGKSKFFLKSYAGVNPDLADVTGAVSSGGSRNNLTGGIPTEVSLSGGYRGFFGALDVFEVGMKGEGGGGFEIEFARKGRQRKSWKEWLGGDYAGPNVTVEGSNITPFIIPRAGGDSLLPLFLHSSVNFSLNESTSYLLTRGYSSLDLTAISGTVRLESIQGRAEGGPWFEAEMKRQVRRIVPDVTKAGKKGPPAVLCSKETLAWGYPVGANAPPNLAAKLSLNLSVGFGRIESCLIGMNQGKEHQQVSNCEAQRAPLK